MIPYSIGGLAFSMVIREPGSSAISQGSWGASCTFCIWLEEERSECGGSHEGYQRSGLQAAHASSHIPLLCHMAAHSCKDTETRSLPGRAQKGEEKHVYWRALASSVTPLHLSGWLRTREGKRWEENQQD